MDYYGNNIRIHLSKENKDIFNLI